MSTRSWIGYQKRDGKCQAVYCHWDGYPSWNGKELLEHYNDEASAKMLVWGGDMSSLTKKDENGELVHEPKYYKENGADARDFDTLDKLVNSFKNSDAEYLYVFNCECGKWLVTGASNRFGWHRYYLGKIWEDLEIRVKDDLEHEQMAEDKEHYWKPPCRPVKNMYDMFSARGNMQQMMEYDLPIGLPLIDVAGYGCHGYSCCWIADKRTTDEGRFLYTIVGYDVHDERERDGRPYWHRSTHDGHIYPYSEKFGVGYYFDDRFTNPRLLSAVDIAEIMKEIGENEREEQEKRRKDLAESERKVMEGRRMWDEAFEKWHEANKRKPVAVIVAEHEEFDGNVYTDDFSTRLTAIVPLCFSSNTRRMEHEFRMAASLSAKDGIRKFADKSEGYMDDGELRTRGYGWRICKYKLDTVNSYSVSRILPYMEEFGQDFCKMCG